MNGDYLWDGSGPRDADIAALEDVLKPLRLPNPPPPLRHPTRHPRAHALAVLIALAGAAAVIALVIFVRWSSLQPGAALHVTRVAGAPVIGKRAITDEAVLPVGRWLQTDAQARASIDVADIGRVEIDPETRVAAVGSRPGDVRLHLERGTLHARIWAPPGQFSVETPSSTTIDLGCAYTLTVEEDGVGLVTVTSGWVGFEWHGRESFIPEGAVCHTRPNLGPGTPYNGDAPQRVIDAIDVIDTRAGSAADRSAALDVVLAAARPRDVVTLWHLLTRVDDANRGRVFDRLASFVPPPAGVTRDGTRAGNREMLDTWWDALGLGTTSWWRTWKQQWR